MIAYFFKSYNDSQSQYFSFSLVENDNEILNLVGVHFEMNFTENDIINKANEIAQNFPQYILENIIIDYANSTINNIG